MNTNSALLRPLALLLALAPVACRGALPVTVHEETPPGSDTWTAIPAEPSWVKGTPRKADHLVFVVDSQSNLRPLARTNLDDWASRQIALRVEAALRPVLTAPEAAAAASAASSSVHLIHCVCREEVRRGGSAAVALVPDRTVTVWGLYETPIEKVLAPLDESRRSAARTALK